MIKQIECEKCGWEWNTKDSKEFDKYVCHKCDHDNSSIYKSLKEDNTKMIKLISILQEVKRKGLWANIHAKQKRGEKPARKGSEAFKKAVKAAKDINSSMDETLSPKIYQIEGRLMADTTQRSLADILSDIRAIVGITVVRVTNNRQPSAEKLKKYVVDISIKIDPGPFDNFSPQTIKSIEDKVKAVPAVRKVDFSNKTKLVKS
jgi:hypothetical protein